MDKIPKNRGRPGLNRDESRGDSISRFGSINAVVANAVIFFTKPFTDYTPDDFRRLYETNLEGYLYITQLAVKQMLAQKTGASVNCVTSAIIHHPLPE